MANGFPSSNGRAGLWPFVHYLYDNYNNLMTPGFKGKTYYVDALNGNASATDGDTWSTAFKTMAQAFVKIASGDRVFFSGKVQEQLTTPVNVFDVAIIGIGNRPHHADATPAGGNIGCATWAAPASPTATTPLCTVIQQGWGFYNILFAGPSDSDCVRLFRNAGAGDLERDSGHAVFDGCRFASGLNAINDTGGNVDVLVQRCRFEAFTGFCILGVGNIGVGQSDWLIQDNVFDGFDNGVKIAAFGCVVQRNTFTDGLTPNTTVVLNVSNGGGADNMIINNAFQTLTANFNTPDVVGNATDVWTLNCAFNTAAAGTSGIYETGQPA
jgi:hypothetical protein